MKITNFWIVQNPQCYSTLDDIFHEQPAETLHQWILGAKSIALGLAEGRELGITYYLGRERALADAVVRLGAQAGSAGIAQSNRSLLVARPAFGRLAAARHHETRLCRGVGNGVAEGMQRDGIRLADLGADIRPGNGVHRPGQTSVAGSRRFR